MRFRKFASLFAFLSFLFVHISVSGYVLERPLFESTAPTPEALPGEGQHKVFFYDASGKLEKTMYVEDGYTLRLRDAPHYASGSQYSLWTSNVLNNRILNDHIEVTSDMGDIQFRETLQDPDDISATYNEGLSITATGNQDVILKNKVSITNQGITGTVTCNISARIDSHYQTLPPATIYEYQEDTHLNPKEEGEIDGINIRTNGDGEGGTVNIGDFSIGLESTNEPTSAYKPNAGGTSFAADNDQDNGEFNKYSTNYCPIRITLETDVVLMNGGITLGAMTGYYGENPSFSQYNFQGFIVGSYTELDLNGYDLVLESGGWLDAWGSVTDSSRYKEDGSYDDTLTDDKKGHLILRNGSTLWTCFVIEDYYRPDSIVTSYINGSACFTMYRTPYIDCDTYLYSGCNYYGKLRVDLAGTGNDGISGDILLFGNDGLISFSSKPGENGYVERKVSYDMSLLENKATYWRAIKNIQHQKISYTFSDCTAQFNSFSFEIGMSNVNIDFQSLRSPFFISPYYDFYFENCTFTLNQQLIFMPGTYVSFDKGSVLNLSWGSTGSDSLGISGLISDAGNDSITWQPVAGLTFLPYIYPRLSSGGYVNVGDEHGREISDYASSNNKVFWDYVNAQGSSCDFMGTICFIAGPGQQYHPISFGGNINIYQFDQFKSAVESAMKSIKIDLISNNFLAGPNYAKNNKIFGIIETRVGGQNHLYVSNFFNVPLLSNGHVVADISGSTAIDDSNRLNTFARQKITWDALNNVFEDEEGQLYAYFYNNDESLNLYKSQDLDSDNLAGSIRQVYPTGKDRVYSLSADPNDTSQDYICFNGMMLKVDSNMQGKVPKFCGSAVDSHLESGTKRNKDTTYRFSLLADSEFWGATIA